MGKLNSVKYQILTNLTCNLDCSYCYEKKLNWVNNYKSVERFLSVMFNKDKNKYDKVIIEFIGGEPFLAIDLISKTSEYVKNNFKKFGFLKFEFHFTTNGTLLNNLKVKKYLELFKQNLYLSISIDGVKSKHDLHRCYVNSNKGSYEDVIEGFNTSSDILGLDRVSAKSTFTKDSFHLYNESVKHIFSLGIDKIYANVIYEDIYTLDWAEKYLLDMLDLMDFISNEIFNGRVISFNNFLVNNSTSMKYYNIPLSKTVKNSNSCGACSNMICLGKEDKVYPCNRFVSMNKNNMNIGSIVKDSLVDNNVELKQDILNTYKKIPEDCNNCPVVNYCSSCLALPYEFNSKIEKINYLNSKPQCGWTWLMVISSKYLESKLSKGM